MPHGRNHERKIIRFKLRDRNGQVTIKYGPNEEPEELGLQRLNLKHNISRSMGFPAIETRIQYPGKGYDAFMGWIEIVRFRLFMGAAGYSGNLTEVVDMPQCFNGADSPFCCYGSKPAFFDAPSVTYGGIRWEAHTWLAVTPDVVTGRTVRPILGFSRGYFKEKERPELASLDVLTEDNWKEDVKVLGRKWGSGSLMVNCKWTACGVMSMVLNTAGK